MRGGNNAQSSALSEPWPLRYFQEKAMKLGARRGAKVSTTTRRGPTMDENHPLLLQHTPLSYYGIIRYKSTNTIRPLLNTQQPDNRMAAAIRYSRVEGTGDGYLVTMNNSAQNASPFTFSHPGSGRSFRTHRYD